MKKIELSVSTAMSLLTLSSSGSEEAEEVETEEVSAIDNLSDEEFEKLSEEEFAKLESGSGEDEDDGDAEEDQTLGDDDEDDLEEESNQEESTEAADEEGSEEEESDGESEGNQPNEDKPATDDEKYMEAFNMLFGEPIKASGREVKLRNPEHARNFIEMGIDYNKKMQYMRPHLRTLKTLEKEGLLSEDKLDRLNLLLEVEKGNKDALKRLIAESDIDPLDLADEDVIEEGKNYTPNNHIISEKEVEIEEALNEIQGSPAHERTINVMTREFDPRSREIISDNPRYIVSLNHDIETGVYDEVMKEVQYVKDMNMAPKGMSDIELYIEVVKTMAENNQQGSVQEPTPTGQQRRGGRSSSKKQKIAMSGNKRASKSSKKEYDPLEIMDMSDEEFERQFGGTLR